MTLGIVVVTFECRDLALACMESIGRHLPGVLARTVVVDNASSDGTVAAIGERFPMVTVVTRAKNVGFAAAANAGMRKLECEPVICLLNPDAVLLDGGLLGAAAYLEEHPSVGVLGGRIENTDGTLQPSARAFPGHLNALFNRHSLTTKLLPANRWSSRYLMTGWEHDEIRMVDWVSGAFMVFHRRAIEAVGLLDPRYFFSIEDVDYCRRVRDKGLEVAYFPRAGVRHAVGGSSRHAVYRAMAAHHRGMWIYYRDHLRGNGAVDAITAAGIVARFVVHAVSYAGRTAFNRLRGAPNP